MTYSSVRFAAQFETQWDINQNIIMIIIRMNRHLMVIPIMHQGKGLSPSRYWVDNPETIFNNFSW